MDESRRGRVVGVVPTRRAFEAVLHRLEVTGFDHAQFGVLAPGSRGRRLATAKGTGARPRIPAMAPLKANVIVPQRSGMSTSVR